MRVIIVAGGTGGHLFPGLAIAWKLKEEEEGAEIIFIGRKGGWEERVVSREGFKFISISAGGWLGKSPGRKICSALESLRGFRQSFFVLKRLRPQVVVGMGGYVSGSFLLASWLFSLPTIIHEQNLVPGLTNRILARFVDEVEVSFPESNRFFPRGRVRVTGNPVREEIGKSRAGGRKSKNKRTLLVMGGSQGAHRINLVLAEASGFLKGKMGSWQIIHLSGKEDYELMVGTYKEAGIEAVVYPFLERMEEAYGEADLVVARAGATTVAEIMACGLPAILIPYSFATKHHQERNARWLEGKGAAITLREEKLTGERLAETILSLISDEERLSRMAEKSRRLSKPQAAEEVVKRMLDLARKLHNHR